MMRKKGFLLLLLFAVVLAQPSEMPDGSGSSDLKFGLTFNEDVPEDETQDTQGAEAFAKLQQTFGIVEPSDGLSPHKIPPQFMMELYNTIADFNGVTRGKNPYNAKIVRSFIERESSVSQLYLFNITGLEPNESVLEAELHLYRKRTPLKAMHPAVLSSPYYLIRVYQVLDEHQLDIPDLHRLLNVHYVGAHASGWQVFNVKQAVLSWMSGAPNLGLLVTASNLFGGDAAVHFARRNDYRHNKQPILVLFDDDGKDTPPGENIIPRYYKYGNDLDEDEEEETGNYNDPKIELDNHSSFGSDKFESQKRRQRREAPSPKKSRRVVSKKAKIGEALTSMDIYDRAMLRKKLARRGNVVRGETPSSNSDLAGKQRRSRSTAESSTPKSNTKNECNATECTRHELYIDIKEIGWSNYIIAPAGYSAYHCKGQCSYPCSLNRRSNNHAKVQSLVHMKQQENDVNPPCCVPTKLSSISMLYLLDKDQAVLNTYPDMVAEQCGCR